MNEGCHPSQDWLCYLERKKKKESIKIHLEKQEISGPRLSRGRGGRGRGGPLKRRCLGLEKRGSNYENESPCTARIFISAVAMGTGLGRLLPPPLPRRAVLQHNTMERRDFHRRRKEGRDEGENFPLFFFFFLILTAVNVFYSFSCSGSVWQEVSANHSSVITDNTVSS